MIVQINVQIYSHSKARNLPVNGLALENKVPLSFLLENFRLRGKYWHWGVHGANMIKLLPWWVFSHTLSPPVIPWESSSPILNSVSKTMFRPCHGLFGITCLSKSMLGINYESFFSWHRTLKGCTSNNTLESLLFSDKNNLLAWYKYSHFAFKIKYIKLQLLYVYQFPNAITSR